MERLIMFYVTAGGSIPKMLSAVVLVTIGNAIVLGTLAFGVTLGIRAALHV